MAQLTGTNTDSRKSQDEEEFPRILSEGEASGSLSLSGCILVGRKIPIALMSVSAKRGCVKGSEIHPIHTQTAVNEQLSSYAVGGYSTRL